ncbi:MAG: GxxExxY protein [Phycisphaerae bacterium]|nr:GxxExxY protein [Phycisphaerae bacterium]
MGKLLFRDETYAIRGAVFEVHCEMGSGFLESVYQECMEKELTRQGIPFEAEKKLSILYKNEPLNQIYKPDLICYGEILVELKSVAALRREHYAQVINYLKATNLRLGLLVNFGSHPKATIERLIR